MNVAVCPEHLNLISICTGGFGLDLGVELAVPSTRTVCMVEREAFAVAQLVSAMEAGHMAPAPIWSDARTFNGRAWRGAVDGLIGGIPCQPHSLAGRKQGKNDERDLWSDARRIIVQSGAWFVLIENVSGMLSAGSDEIAGAERVCRDLHKLGFAVEGGLFTASEVGAPHERERVFILGISGVGLADSFCEGLQRRPRQEIWDEQQAVKRSGENMDDTSIARGWPVSIQPGRQEQACSDANRASLRYGGLPKIKHMADAYRDEPAAFRRNAREVQDTPEGEGRTEYRSALSGRLGLPDFPPGPGDADGWRHVLSRAPELEPAFRRVADGVASRMDIARVDRLRMLGNGVVPLEAAYALRTLITRLAARGPASAARLVRMMEGIEI